MLDALTTLDLVAINSRQLFTFALILWIPLSLIVVLNRYFPSVIGIDQDQDSIDSQVTREALNDDDTDQDEFAVVQLDETAPKAAVLNETDTIEQLDVAEFDNDEQAAEESVETKLVDDTDFNDEVSDTEINEVDPELAQWFPVEDSEDGDVASGDTDDNTDDDTDNQDSSDDNDSDDSSDDDLEDSQVFSLDSIMSEMNLPSKVKLADDARATKAKAYSSSEYEAVDVGSRFADELERLGYEIIPNGHSEAKAVKGDIALKMTITPENSELTDGDDLIYPAIDEDDVVVQIWLEE